LVARKLGKLVEQLNALLQQKHHPRMVVPTCRGVIPSMEEIVSHRLDGQN